MFIRSAYNYDRRQASLDSGLVCDEPSMTHQSFKEECDINTIVRRFGLTGTIPEGWRAPQYGDFEGVMDYQSMLDALREADASFMELPAEVRDRFANDPGRLMQFLAKDENKDEAIKLGLVSAPVVTPPVVPLKVVVVDPTS